MCDTFWKICTPPILVNIYVLAPGIKQPGSRTGGGGGNGQSLPCGLGELWLLKTDGLSTGRMHHGAGLSSQPKPTAVKPSSEHPLTKGASGYFSIPLGRHTLIFLRQCPWWSPQIIEVAFSDSTYNQTQYVRHKAVPKQTGRVRFFRQPDSEPGWGWLSPGQCPWVSPGAADTLFHASGNYWHKVDGKWAQGPQVCPLFCGSGMASQ